MNVLHMKKTAQTVSVGEKRKNGQRILSSSRFETSDNQTAQEDSAVRPSHVAVTTDKHIAAAGGPFRFLLVPSFSGSVL